MKKGAPSVNPSGRPPKTDEMREAEEALAKLSPVAVKKLEQLMQTADEKIQAQVALGIVKATIGELSRVSDKDGNPLAGFANMTREEILEVARSGK
jgi:hypothetical protein